MWRRCVVLVLMLVLPLPSLAGWVGGCASDAPAAAHAMADMDAHAAAPCCPDEAASSACVQHDCATAALHFALPAARADLSERAHVLRAAPMPRFASVTVARHDRPPIPAA